MACAYIDRNTSKEKYDSFDIVQEPQRIYLFIEENEIISASSLEKAVNPLIEFIPNIHEKVQLAKQKCIHPSDGLSCDESASIYLLSMRWEPYDKCFYSILNDTLRNRNHEKLKPWNLYLRLLYTALDHLPSIRITFYREMEYDLIKHYSKENIFIIRDFTFCSLSVALSESNQPVDSIEKRTFYAFECLNTKFIERHSCDYWKNEILLVPTQFQFIDYLDRKNDLDIIRLREINKFFPLIKVATASNQPSTITSTKEVNQQTTITTEPIITSVDNVYRNPKLERLISLHQSRSAMNLTHQQLTPEDMHIIIAQSIVGKQCTSLLLDNNRITTDCLSILVPALNNNKTLKELHLYDTGITDDSLRILTRALALNNCSIDKLNLSRNRITDKSLPELLEMLKTNTTLSRIWLYSNPISKKGMKRFMKELENIAAVSIM